MEIIFPDSAKFLRIGIQNPVDKDGNPTEVDGVVYSSSDPSVFEIRDNTDEDGNVIPNTCIVWPTGKAGAAAITADVDVDLGEGIKPLHGEFSAVLHAGEAVSFQFSIGGFEDKPTGETTEEPPTE